MEASGTTRASDVNLWIADDRSRFFLIPASDPLPSGTLRVRTLTGQEASVDPTSLRANELTEAQARRWAKDQLGQTLDELKAGIDEKLADLRQQLGDFNRRPVSPDSTVTPDAASALLDFLKQLPRVVGQSLSGDDSRVDAAREAMANLQRRLNDAGIEVDDRVKDFPSRLAELRKNPAESQD